MTLAWPLQIASTDVLYWEADRAKKQSIYRHVYEPNVFPSRIKTMLSCFLYPGIPGWKNWLKYETYISSFWPFLGRSCLTGQECRCCFLPTYIELKMPTHAPSKQTRLRWVEVRSELVALFANEFGRRGLDQIVNYTNYSMPSRDLQSHK